MLANINKIVEDKLHQQIIDNAEVVERTPPTFFIKALTIITITVLITLGVRAIKKNKKK